ncbi:hypothetical protein I8D50_001239 [Vibrio vulnificus]|uniref:hypothetical protein n=1 Tax=Vibrio vulnificus TaxID=672 RepID=UPI00165E2EF1|nr:hypothetical protein [Vibrio vulnificus]EGR9007137.1 hypothetical protein [Vibrio vulnificus]EHU9456380.1 hypothetical protein [Vibrio vulnificus]HAS6191666.1 hypothetical protein [Vibrio vulnificus]HAS8255877.1 hypothetical protein [Vibrio vulnificus]HDY7728961.1 hypothetical protein [Vibrio vulnificus]
MAKPNKKAPERTVEIICSKCRALLFKYRKGGKGALVKCFKERIVDNYCEIACHCPNCDSEFARDSLIRGTPAYKLIGGKAKLK